MTTATRSGSLAAMTILLLLTPGCVPSIGTTTSPATGVEGGTGGSGVDTPGGGGGIGGSLACGPSVSSGRAGRSGASSSAPNLVGLVTSNQPPPPISGGTLIALRDGTTAVAADPDRDLVYVVDLSDTMQPRLRWSITLNPGDQPGRLVEDAAGHVHVALRNAGALATIDPATGQVTLRRSVCQAPRGVAYDDATDRLHVACAGGELISFTPDGSSPVRALTLDQDLRDVIVDGPRLMVTKFRSAQVLMIDADGAVMERISPSTFVDPTVHQGEVFEPAVAWRAVGMPGGGATMVHQRAMRGTVGQSPGGYGGPTCDTIVHTAVSVVRSGGIPDAGPAIPGFVLPVDIAVSPDGKRVALVAAGNGRATVSGAGQKLFVTNRDDVTLPWSGGCTLDGRHAPATCISPSTGGGGRGSTVAVSSTDGAAGAIGTAGTVGSGSSEGTGGVGGQAGRSAAGGRTGAVSASGTGGSSDVGGGLGTAGATGAGGRSGSQLLPCRDLPQGAEPTAVTFIGADTVIVQTREPAQLWVVKQGDATDAANPLPAPFAVTLSTQTRADLGHAVFHSNSGAGLACASCHPEGHEDGRLWNFQCEGDRRTQDIGGGLSGTEPFHWSGDLADFPTLLSTVFVGRMSGPVLTSDQTAATLAWINNIPARPAPRSADDSQVGRGRTLFQDPTVGCATCHTGPLLTNNMTVGVGTANGPFQVPSLRGVAWRAPYMHNGCAPDLTSRFSNTACGGGDSHGKTSGLTQPQIADLVAYLQSL